MLGEDNKEYFSDEFPIFYLNKIYKTGSNKRYFYRTAIDRALKANQVRAVSLMIEYIIKNQNNYTASYLFSKNIPDLLEKGIDLHELFNSNIFTHTFDYDQWPGSHINNDTIIRPYNDSLFRIRYNYDRVFHEDEFKPLEDQANDDAASEKIDSSKVYKIRYSVNLLPQVGFHIRKNLDGGLENVNTTVGFMQLLNESDELEIFATETITQLLDFKWEEYALTFHKIGCLMQIFYVIMMFVYINSIYINTSGTASEKQLYTILLALGILYPTLYHITKMCRDGICNYFSQIKNYQDIFYIYASIANIILQNILDPEDLACKILMIFIILLAVVKTFYYLKIFGALSPIVTMLANVIYDLRIFMLFYIILIVLFSLLLGILGLGNKDIEGGFKQMYGDKTVADGYPGSEYENVGLYLGNILTVLRMSMGDFGFDSAYLLSSTENIIYWFVWAIIVVVTCIIFLNFIIAEASASYEKVASDLEAYIMKEKALLIQEAELMMPAQLKNIDKFPTYLIVRQKEE